MVAPSFGLVWDVIARICSRFAVLIIGLWVLAAAAGNLLVPQVESTAHNHARGFLPADAPVPYAPPLLAKRHAPLE